jgi:hypothetical protein
MKELLFLTTLFLGAGNADAQNELENTANTVDYPIVSGGDVDGFFTSAACSVDIQKVRLSFYYEAVLPIWTVFSGSSFSWNAGLIYSF